MFTGIVEETGQVLAFEPDAQAWRLVVSARTALVDLAPGDSIAVNGCCLTATASDASSLQFDLLEETRRLTNFAALRQGALVNLERSLRFGGKVGGHFVTGHIDGTGTVLEKHPNGEWLTVWFGYPKEFGELLVPKGSIAVDGVSLTVVDVEPERFSVMLIPHTRDHTTLGLKEAGASVNLEFDLLAKHVRKLVQSATITI